MGCVAGYYFFLLQWSNILDSPSLILSLVTCYVAGSDSLLAYILVVCNKVMKQGSFFKAREVFTVMQPAAQLFKIAGIVTRKDAQDLSTVILSTMSPPPQCIQSHESLSQTSNYKCNELKWQNYSVGGVERATRQDVSCCRLFCFYHMCCVVHFQDPPSAKITAGAQNLSEHMLEHLYN